MITSKSPFEINWPLVIHYFGQLYLKFPRNYNFLKPFFSEEIADVKTELEEEGFTSDEAVKLIQQVYRKIGGFDNKSKEHSYPVHEKVSGQFSSKIFYQIFKWTSLTRVNVQGVKSVGGHFDCLCRGFDFYEVKKYVSKRKGKYSYTLIIFIVKSLQTEQNGTNLLLWSPICRNKRAITPKWINS